MVCEAFGGGVLHTYPSCVMICVMSLMYIWRMLYVHKHPKLSEST